MKNKTLYLLWILLLMFLVWAMYFPAYEPKLEDIEKDIDVEWLNDIPKETRCIMEARLEGTDIYLLMGNDTNRNNELELSELTEIHRLLENGTYEKMTNWELVQPVMQKEL